MSFNLRLSSFGKPAAFANKVDTITLFIYTNAVGPAVTQYTSKYSGLFSAVS